MLFTRTRLAVTMAMACACFGCKGAGEVFKVASVVAVTAARVAVVAAATAPRRSYEGGETEVVPVAEPVEVPPVSAPPRCVEVPPEPEMPEDRFAVRTVVCSNRVMVQDAQTGMWREHR